MKAEIAEINKRWFLKPQWWSVLVPLIIGAGTIIIAFSTGIISVERLTNEKYDLQKTIAAQKDSIANSSKELESQRAVSIQLIKTEQSEVAGLRSLSDSLRAANSNQRGLILKSEQEKLERVNREIYMYEDHDSIYKRLDAAMHDTTSRGQRAQKLKDLRKDRETIKEHVKALTSFKLK